MVVVRLLACEGRMHVSPTLPVPSQVTVKPLGRDASTFLSYLPTNSSILDSLPIQLDSTRYTREIRN
jgi:hypothetical protein